MEDPDFSELLTKRLRIRRFHPRDIDALSAYRSDPEVARFQGWESCTRGEAKQFIGSIAGVNPGAQGQWFQFAFALRESDELIGDCGLRCTQRDPQHAELGFTLSRPWQLRGFAREAISAVVTYAFQTLRLHRIYAITDERNDPAQKLLRALSFQLEQRFRERTWFKGAWATELAYAVLGEEWRGRG
jgi:RimJ/RimL family protein N-acetyltransferase